MTQFTIPAGRSETVPLAAGATVSVSGNGATLMIQAGPKQTTHALRSTAQVFGPFALDASMSMIGAASPIVYEVTDPVSPKNELTVAEVTTIRAQQSAVTALVSGGGKDWGGASVYDDFSGPIAALNGRVAPSGQSWVESSAAATAGDGRMDATSNVYPRLPYGKQIVYIGGAFSFAGNGNRTVTGCTLIASQPTGDGLQTMLHLIVAPLNWTLQKRVAGGSFDVLAGGTHNLTVNGSFYHAGMLVNKATGAVTILLPDGTEVTTATDAAVAAMDLTQGIWQLLNDSAAANCFWHAVAMGELRPSNRGRLAISGAASAADLQNAKGYGITQKTVWRGTVSGTGWFRLVDRAIFSNYFVMGTLKVSAKDSVLGQMFVVDVKANSSSTPVLTERLALFAAGRMISQLRVSRNSGTGDVALDANFGTEYSGRDISIEWEGVGVLQAPPTPGATAFATETVTLTLS